MLLNASHFEPTARVLRFSLHSNQLREGTSMPALLFDSQVIYHETCLYVWGGRSRIDNQTLFSKRGYKYSSHPIVGTPLSMMNGVRFLLCSTLVYMDLSANQDLASFWLEEWWTNSLPTPPLKFTTPLSRNLKHHYFSPTEWYNNVKCLDLPTIDKRMGVPDIVARDPSFRWMHVESIVFTNLAAGYSLPVNLVEWFHYKLHRTFTTDNITRCLTIASLSFSLPKQLPRILWNKSKWSQTNSSIQYTLNRSVTIFRYSFLSFLVWVSQSPVRRASPSTLQSFPDLSLCVGATPAHDRKHLLMSQQFLPPWFHVLSSPFIIIYGSN